MRLAGVLLGLSLMPSLGAADFLADADPDTALYPNLRVGVGPSWTHNTSLESFRFDRGSLPGWETNDVARSVRKELTAQSDVEFTIGPTMAIGIGGQMRMPHWLHVEAATGMTLNQLQFRADNTDFKGDLWQVPLAVNLSVPYELSEAWEIFGGIGGGVMFGVLDLESRAVQVREVEGAQNTVTTGGSSLTGAGTYQAFAGLRYRLKPSSGLSLTYRFRGVTASDWNWKAELDGVEGDWELGTDSLYSHSLLLFFDYNW